MTLKLRDSNRTLYWGEFFKKNAPEYTEQMKLVGSMEDTFGLCGLISYFILGIATVPAVWKSIKFNALHYKNEFDRHIAGTSVLKTSPALDFINKNNKIFQRSLLEISTMSDFLSLYRKLNVNQKLYFAIVFNYPKYAGSYTHWIALLEIADNKAVIAGDLSPFGVKNSFIKEVEFSKLFELIKDTLNQSPSTINAKILEKDATASGARNDQRFTSNVGLATFIE